MSRNNEVKLRPGIEDRSMKFLAIVAFSILLLYSIPCGAESREVRSGYDIIPIAATSQFSTGERSVESPGMALVVQNEREQYVGSYQKISLNKPPLFHLPVQYHAINFLGDIHHQPWNTLLIFKSESDQPVSGGLRTFQLGSAVGYDFHNGSSSSLVLGGGLAIGDFGAKLPNGNPLPIIPIPLVRYQNKWEMIELTFDFLTGPNMSLTLGPYHHIRINCDVRLDNFRDTGDILFESIVWYRFFDATHEYGDFAGIGLGLKRDEISFDLARRELPFAMQYNSAFVTLDLSLLKISVGSTYHAVERHGDVFKLALDKGKFAEFQLLYQF